jgi:TetR/AcrR family transcriptional repressor of nem operon
MIAQEDNAQARIVRTAFQLFHEQGYHATGIATILREADVNPGSMYHAFAGKEALLEEVLRYALTLLRPAVIAPVEAKEADPLNRVFGLLEQYRDGMAHNSCRMGCPIGNLALEVSDDHRGARVLIAANFENWVKEVSAWLQSAGDRLPKDIDRARLARFVLTVMEGGVMQARAAGNLAPFDASVSELRTYFSLLEERATATRKPGKKVKR